MANEIILKRGSGSDPSASDLVVGEVAVRTDNHGSKFTGDQRLYVVADWYNPTGIGDSLTFGFLQSFSPEESQLGQLNYSSSKVAISSPNF